MPEHRDPMMPGHRLPTGETLMGYTDAGTPIWSEPVVMDAPPTSDQDAAPAFRATPTQSGASPTGASGAAPPTSQLAADRLGYHRSALVKALNDSRPSPNWDWEILNTWDALVARVTDLEAHATRVTDEWQAAEAQVAALTQERDEAVAALTEPNYARRLAERADAAEALLATTRQALTEIAHPSCGDHQRWFIARRALAETEQT